MQRSRLELACRSKLHGLPSPSVADYATIFTPVRSAIKTPPADKPLTDEELDELVKEKLLTEDERKELKRLQNELNSTE